jgi:hypothetical protein
MRSSKKNCSIAAHVLQDPTERKVVVRSGEMAEDLIERA